MGTETTSRRPFGCGNSRVTLSEAKGLKRRNVRPFAVCAAQGCFAGYLEFCATRACRKPCHGEARAAHVVTRCLGLHSAARDRVPVTAGCRVGPPPSRAPRCFRSPPSRVRRRTFPALAACTYPDARQAGDAWHPGRHQRPADRECLDLARTAALARATSVRDVVGGRTRSIRQVLTARRCARITSRPVR